MNNIDVTRLILDELNMQSKIDVTCFILDKWDGMLPLMIEQITLICYSYRMTKDKPMITSER